MGIGASFEREIAKKMSLWLTGGNDENCVWRSKSSGGRATYQRRRYGEHNKVYDFGDLGPDDSKVFFFFDVFNCELKTGYARKTKKGMVKWDLLELIDSNQQLPMFYNFWEQCVTDSNESGREPMLIFRRNRMEPCIAIRSDIFGFLCNLSKKPIGFDYVTVKLANDPLFITVSNVYHFFDHTWNVLNYGTIRRMAITVSLKRKGI